MSNNKFKVLVVEDEANICSFIETLLETNGYQALVANTCAMGQTLFTSHNPDLIILDLGLPDMDGVDIIKKGITSAHMQFEKNKKNLSCYNTPLGDLVIGIQANRIRIDEEEDCLKINVEYSLDINYQHASDCNIMLDIQSVQGA